MTCIVGLEHDGHVTIGGDSGGSAGEQIQIMANPKVFRLGEMIIGYTWSFRMGQILQYAEDLPKEIKSQSNHEFLVTEFVPYIRRLMKEAGWLTVKDSKEEGGQFLVGIRGELYEVDSNFAVLRTKDGFNAIGSGSQYALGVMYVLKYKVNQYSDIIEPPRYMVELALDAAAKYSHGVEGPFRFETLIKED